MKSFAINHFIAAVLFSLIMLLIFATVQQTCLTAAHDPQIQITRDIANPIKYTHSYYYLTDNGTDAQQSLGNFKQCYNANGQLIYSGGTINSSTPKTSEGALDNAKQYHENKVMQQSTHQVQPSTAAAYIDKRDTACIVVTRSLQNKENREANLTELSLLVWAAGIGIIAAHCFMQNKINC